MCMWPQRTLAHADRGCPSRNRKYREMASLQAHRAEGHRRLWDNRVSGWPPPQQGPVHEAQQFRYQAGECSNSALKGKVLSDDSYSICFYSIPLNLTKLLNLTKQNGVGFVCCCYLDI